MNIKRQDPYGGHFRPRSGQFSCLKTGSSLKIECKRIDAWVRRRREQGTKQSSGHVE
jgi:hypothetical protein